MTIASWNVNSIRARLDHLGRWLDDNSPDLLALQETKIQDADFPRDAFAERGYHLTISGQRTYNGVAVFSRSAPLAVHTDIPGLEDPQRRVLGVAFPDLYLLDLYVPNGSAVGTDKYAYKLAWLDALAAWLPKLLAEHPSLVIVGDFNIAPEDRDVHDPEAWRGQVLCSEPERARLKAILDLGFVDTYRQFHPTAGNYSWWDYRAAAFRRNLGLRIDLILANGRAAENCREAAIDRTPRTWERPSDHAPVISRFEL
ncbi:MAG: exodeoxyribonuclease III [Gammaproteobacteria bacterium]|nr:exodeoxyribonuclease III [Gammaproteobacteria bacterium]MBI5619082.1 exodeoxyribonuclease III [Gammaproteobacteria bacterium]